MPILLAVAAGIWWIAASYRWGPSDTIKPWTPLFIIAIVGFALYQPKKRIDAAKAVAERASTYRNQIDKQEAKLPGFEQFYKMYLSAKRNNNEQGLPTATRSFFTQGSGSHLANKQ